MSGDSYRTFRATSWPVDPDPGRDREDRDRATTGPHDTGPLPPARSHDRRADPEPAGFGHRIEKLLLVAEQEAAETRRSATRESTALIERARVEAESLRRDGEQAAVAQRVETERFAEARTTELDAREREIDRLRDAARADADRCLAEAHREADRIVGEAVGRADALRADLDEELAERRAEVSEQMAWLEESRRAARDLAQMMLTQVGDTPAARPEVREEPPPRSGYDESFDVADDRAPVPDDDPLGADRSPRYARDDDPEDRTTSVAGDDLFGAERSYRYVRDDEPDDRTTAVPDVTGPSAPRGHSPYAAPPAELRFAGTFGDVVSPVDEGVTDSGAGHLRAAEYGGAATERMYSLPASPWDHASDTSSDRERRGRTA